MVTETVPVELLEGTTVSIVPPPETTAETTPVPPMVTFAGVAPVRFVPLITKDPPLQPDEAPKLVIVGGATHFTEISNPATGDPVLETNLTVIYPLEFVAVKVVPVATVLRPGEVKFKGVVNSVPTVAPLPS